MEKKRPEDGSSFDKLAWKEISRKTLIHNEWIDFRESAYQFPDGSVFKPFYSYSRRDYVVIVATDEEGRYICVRQYRQGIKEVTTEFPAGGIERRDGKVRQMKLWIRILTSRLRKPWKQPGGSSWKRPATSQMNGSIFLRYRLTRRYLIITHIFTQPGTAGKYQARSLM